MRKVLISHLITKDSKLILEFMYVTGNYETSQFKEMRRLKENWDNEDTLTLNPYILAPVGKICIILYEK